MTSLKNAVLRQVIYAQSVRKVIRLILGRLSEGDWINHVFASSDEEFRGKLDDALKTIDLKAATKKPYCEKIVAVLCNEVAELCETLHAVCEASGYEHYSSAYISRERFVRLVLSVDTVKLGKMRRIVENKELSPIELLRAIGALLDDVPLEVRYGETARELRKGNAEILKVMKATEKTLSCVESKVEEVGRKVSRLRARKRDEGADEKEAAVVAAWNAYRNSVAASMGENTRPTYKGAFEYSRQHLVEAGVETLSEFSRIRRTVISRESWKRVKELGAKRDEAWRKKQPATRAPKPEKYDILHSMTKTIKNAILMGAAIALGLASPLRSDASQVMTGGASGVVGRHSASAREHRWRDRESSLHDQSPELGRCRGETAHDQRQRRTDLRPRIRPAAVLQVES